MPVEIREIIIKTEVRPEGSTPSSQELHRELERFRNVLLFECKKMLIQEKRRKKQTR